MVIVAKRKEIILSPLNTGCDKLSICELACWLACRIANRLVCAWPCPSVKVIEILMEILMQPIFKLIKVIHIFVQTEAQFVEQQI